MTMDAPALSPKPKSAFRKKGRWARLVAGLFAFRSILATSGFVVGARVAGSIAGFATQIILARMIGADNLGIFFIAVSLALVLCTMCTLGYPWIIAPIVSQGERGDGSQLLHFLRWARRDVTIASALLVTPVVVGALLVPGLGADLRVCLVIGALTAPIFAQMRINGALSNAQKRFLLAYSPDLFLRPVLLLAMVALLWKLGWQGSVWILVGLHLILVLGLTVGQSIRLGLTGTETGWRQIGRRAPGLARDRQDIRNQGRLWRLQALPMMVAMLFIGVFADIDLLLASLFLDDAHTAVFGVCLKIALFLAFAVQAIHSIILRDASDAVGSADNRDLRSILIRANVLSVAGSLAALVLVVGFGRQGLGVFGPEFVHGYSCLVILVCAQLVRAAAGPATQILAITGHQKAALPVFAAGLGLLIVLNAVLVPVWGLIGAALAVLVVTAFWSLGLAVVAWRTAKIRVTLI